jgi:uncharacterized protein YdhG (YjbR/CyaY superfamily)
METQKFKTVDEYIAAQPEEKRAVLQDIRKTVKSAAPQATEVISYGMPAVKGKGIIIYYAAQKEHYGLYPTADGIIAFEQELSAYETSKGAIRFPADKPIDHELITRIVSYRVQRDAEKSRK